jgi:ferredoxin--NADP+ reductase
LEPEPLLPVEHPAPVRVAIVGSGPAGLYAADALLRQDELEVHVDVVERLPTPWGLVRAGVAPDHPKIKSVTRVYEKTAAHPRLRYFGNVEVGRDVTRDELLARYDAVVYAVGAPDDRPMGIPGERLPGSWAATDFVGWYNGHPDHCDLEPDLGSERAVVIGNGNVAIDVARMLTLDPAELARTDIADHALERLARSAIREVVVIGRRGPEQAAFTTPELRELGELAGVDVVVDPEELAVAEQLPDPHAGTTARRNLELLRAYARRPAPSRPRRVVLRFARSPAGILGAERVEGIELVHNELRAGDDGALRAHATARRSTLAAGLVVRAIGYRGRPVPGVAFDERRGVVPNDRGRELDAGRPRPGEYVVGWAKRGASGVIGTNKKDAAETVRALVEDLASPRRRPAGRRPDDELLRFWLERAPDLVSYGDWEGIDAHERALGLADGRPRVKLRRVADMLALRGER